MEGLTAKSPSLSLLQHFHAMHTIHAPIARNPHKAFTHNSARPLASASSPPPPPWVSRSSRHRKRHDRWGAAAWGWWRWLPSWSERPLPPPRRRSRRACHRCLPCAVSDRPFSFLSRIKGSNRMAHWSTDEEEGLWCHLRDPSSPPLCAAVPPESDRCPDSAQAWGRLEVSWRPPLVDVGRIIACGFVAVLDVRVWSKGLPFVGVGLLLVREMSSVSSGGGWRRFSVKVSLSWMSGWRDIRL